MQRSASAAIAALFKGVACLASLAACAIGQAQTHTFAANAQHTSVFNTPAQNLNRIKWTVDIDLNNAGAFAHYGAPLVTAANTILIPVKTATNGFQVTALNGDGIAKYTLSSDYILPAHNWIPVYQPVLTSGPSGLRMYYAGAGGTIWYVDNVDSLTPTTPTRLVFYGAGSYDANPAGFNATVFVDSPITADSNGNIFFTFRVQGTPPAPLTANQSGIARIDSFGNGSYVLATNAAADAQITRVPHNSAPALSADEQTLYVLVKWAPNAFYGYLLGLDATNLSTKHKVFLRDPRNNNNAGILDDSTASPMVAPDNDVYIGTFANPSNASRGFLLRFNSTLTVQKTPGGFGWDYTPGLVPSTMVPSYTGPSSYLIFAKYNNYAFGDGDGINRIALLDPNATQIDPRPSANSLVEMREVFTVIGPVRDAGFPTFPYAVREWCINAPAVNPSTGSILVPCEDGRVYRWNLGNNSITQAVVLNAGLGQPYVPTVVGPDGTVYVLNGGTLFALGGYDTAQISIASSAPDLRHSISGDSITFTATVLGSLPTAPTGTVTFTALTYDGTTPVTTTLAADVPLDGSGQASVTTTALTTNGVNFLGNYHVTATYNGDLFYGPGSAMLHQKVHVQQPAATLASSANPAPYGSSVTFTASVQPVAPETRMPTGQVTFRHGPDVVAQVPLNATGQASFSMSSLPLGSNSITAEYASDTVFAAASAALDQLITSSTATAVTTSPNPSTFGQSMTITATVTSTGAPITPAGTVTFTDGGTTLGSASVNAAGVASISTSALAVGTRTITATFSGENGWLGSSGTATHDVNETTSTAVSTTPNPSTFGGGVTVTATVTPTTAGAGVPAGTVTFTADGSLLGSSALDGNGQASLSISTLAVGSHSIVASFAGDGPWQDSEGTTSHLVQQATTTVVISSQNPSTYGQSVSIAARVRPTNPDAGTAAGTVTFTEGSTVLATVALDSLGEAGFNISTLAVGDHTITASFTGAAGWLDSSGSLVQSVHGPTTTTLAASPSPSVQGQTVTFTATVSGGAAGTPAGSVAFKEGATTLATVVLNAGGQASFSTSSLSVGNHTIVAEFTGTGGWQNSIASRLHTVNSDTIPPSTPSGVTATRGPGRGQVTLRWNASTDVGTGVANYRVFRSNKLNGAYTLVATVTGLQFVDAPGRNKVRYYYVVAVDVAGNASAPSAKVQGVGRN